MKYSIEDNARIASNLRLIREYFEDDRKNLSKNLEGYSYDTIVAYENGKRSVTDEYIKAISEYYGIPEKLIVEQEITERMLKDFHSRFRPTDYIKLYKCLLSFSATSEAARENDDFLQAEEHRKMILSFEFSLDTFASARGLYYKAFEETGIAAAAANTLMMLIFEYCQLSVVQDCLVEAISGKISKGELYTYFLSIWTDKTPEKKKFIKDTKDVFNKCIEGLSKSLSGRYYAEYYIALEYFMDMVDNERSYRENLEIGYTMLKEFAKSNNDIARHFLDALNIE